MEIAVTLDAVDPSIAVSQVLAVVADRRRRYIGYALKRSAMDWFAGTGGVLVYSEVDEANAPMRACNAVLHAIEDRSAEPEILDVVIRLAVP